MSKYFTLSRTEESPCRRCTNRGEDKETHPECVLCKRIEAFQNGVILETEAHIIAFAEARKPAYIS